MAVVECKLLKERQKIVCTAFYKQQDYLANSVAAWDIWSAAIFSALIQTTKGHHLSVIGTRRCFLERFMLSGRQSNSNEWQLHIGHHLREFRHMSDQHRRVPHWTAVTIFSTRAAVCDDACMSLALIRTSEAISLVRPAVKGYTRTPPRRITSRWSNVVKSMSCFCRRHPPPRL